MEYLLATKGWNPYCAFSHSSITDDSDKLPEFVLKKKARWTMDSRQTARYIKNTLRLDIRNKLLQSVGITVPDENKQESVAVRECQHCHFNAYENELCDKCSRPVNQEAFEKIRKHEESKMNALVDERLREKEKRANIVPESAYLSSQLYLLVP
jgi:integrase/recombinase XerD